MLLRTSGPLVEGLSLLTLGGSCHYLFAEPGKPGPAALGDPGCSAHVGALLERADALGVESKRIAWLFLSGSNAHRIGGVPQLKALLPRLKVAAFRALAEACTRPEFADQLYSEDQRLCRLYNHTPSLSLEEFRRLLKVEWELEESNFVELPGSLRLRGAPVRGYSPLSTAYLLEPINYLLTDQSIGYYRGRDLAAPGADHDLAESRSWLSRLRESGLQGLCFPFMGAVTGGAAGAYISSLVQNIDDLREEVSKAKARSVGKECIREAVRSGFYSPPIADPGMELSMARTLDAVLRQLRLDGEN